MPRVGNQHVYGPWINGWNASKPSDDLDITEIYDGENIRIFPDGSARQRSGSTPFNTVFSGTPTIDAFGQHKFDADTKRIWAIAGGAFYEDTSGVGTGFQDRTNSETITAGNKWSLVDANGTLIGHNGVTNDIILKWSASGNISALGVSSRFTTAKYWEFWDNRAWAANLSSGTARVHRSDIGAIETWGATSFFQMGSIVTGMRKMSNFLVIHGDDIIHLLVPTGNAATPYRQVPKQAKGTIAPFSISTITPPGSPEIQVYVRADGIYAFDGNSSQKISQRMDGERYWEDLNASSLKNAFSCDYPARNEVWFFLPHGTGQTTMNNVLVYNYRMNIFYPRWSGISRNTCAILNDLPYSGGISDGFIFDDEPTTFSDNDGTTANAIDAWFETSSRAPNGEAEQCRWLYARTSLDIVGAYDIEFTATMPSSPEVTDIVETGGTFDAIQTSFTIGSSAIASEDNLVGNVDSLLLGYDPHIMVKYRNGTAAEEFSIRKSTLIYRPIGQTHKRGAGVI